MRKILLALAASAAILLTGCEKILGGWIVDWAPVNIYIEAVDANPGA